MPQRFLTLTDVAEVLNVSMAQTYALVRTGKLKAMKVGGRGQWRVEAARLEAYIEEAHADAERFIAEHPHNVQDEQAGEEEDLP